MVSDSVCWGGGKIEMSGGVSIRREGDDGEGKGGIVVSGVAEEMRGTSW